MKKRTSPSLPSVFYLAATAVWLASAGVGEASLAKGWIDLFNGEDLAGWQVSEAAAQSWSVVDGVIDCDPRTTVPGDSNLWTEESYGDFVFYVEWRLTGTPTLETWPLVGPDGGAVLDEAGERVMATFANADSGIFVRGMSKAQINIWNWPIGSGEVWGYRTDGGQPAEVRAGATPRVRADNPVGEWNAFVITMIGDRLSVILNGELVIDHAQLPGVNERGPIALQYHGGFDQERGVYRNASSLVQFRHLRVKELGAE